MMMLALPFDSIGISQTGCGLRERKKQPRMIFSKVLSIGLSTFIKIGRVFIAESNEWKFEFDVLVLVCSLFGVLCSFVFWSFFILFFFKWSLSAD